MLYNLWKLCNEATFLVQKGVLIVFLMRLCSRLLIGLLTFVRVEM